jgi:hypothetical protein
VAEPAARPTHIIVVDEAGNPPLRAVTGVPNGYVTCAVAIPTGLRDQVIALLPRDPATGEILKAVSQRTTDELLAEFLSSFFALDVAAGIISVDCSDSANVELLQEAVEFANRNRAEQQLKQLNPTATAYLLLAPKAVIQGWAAVSLRQGEHLRHFELIFDEANLHSAHRADFIQGIQQSFKEQGVEVEGVRWASEQMEPLLHVPDYVAGVSLRKFTRGDCPASWDQLEKASGRRQIMVQNPVEIYTLPRKS